MVWLTTREHSPPRPSVWFQVESFCKQHCTCEARLPHYELDIHTFPNLGLIIGAHQLCNPFLFCFATPKHQNKESLKETFLAPVSSCPLKIRASIFFISNSSGACLKEKAILRLSTSPRSSGYVSWYRQSGTNHYIHCERLLICRTVSKYAYFSFHCNIATYPCHIAYATST